MNDKMKLRQVYMTDKEWHEMLEELRVYYGERSGSSTLRMMIKRDYRKLIKSKGAK